MAPLVIGLLTGLAEVERSLIQERTLESVEHRRRTGGNLGGRPGLPQVKKNHIIKLREEGNSLRQIVTLTGVSLAAVQKTCKEHLAMNQEPTSQPTINQQPVNQPSVNQSRVKSSTRKRSKS